MLREWIREISYQLALASRYIRKNQVENAFGAIEAQLKKRRDLVPNLVEAVKRYMAHERELLERLVALRERLEGAAGEEAFRLEGELFRG